jgi:hypothetical protein
LDIIKQKGGKAMDLKRGFKVFRYVNGYLESASPGGVGKKTYQIGFEERPHRDCGPMTVFRDRESAQRFAKGMEKLYLGEMTIRRILYRKSALRKVWNPYTEIDLSTLISSNYSIGVTEESCELASMIIVLGE